MENQTSEETQEETPTEPTKTPLETPVETPAETPEETSEETSEETVEKETPKTPEATVNYEEKFKESQKEAIRLKKENDKFRKKPKESNPTSETDVDKFIEIQSATKGLSPEAISELQFRATATGKSLTEARKDENFGMWHKAYKAKVELEKTPLPSTEQGGKEKPKTFTDQLKQHKVISADNWQDAIEAKAKLLASKGLFKRSRTRENPTKLSR